MSYETKDKELTPGEQVAMAAERLAAVSSELAEHSVNVVNTRGELRRVENDLARSNSEFNEALNALNGLLDQYGLRMDVPTAEPSQFRR